MALLATAGMLAWGCSSSREDKTSTGSGDSGNENSFPTKATGVTADTIKLGFAYVDLEELAKTGIIKVDHGDYERVIEVLVDDLNARGGINGRKIQPFTVKYFPVGNDAQLAACAELTEDNGVFAVLGGFVGDVNLCVTQQHSTILVGGLAGFNQDILAKARAPWATWGASDERNVAALVELLDTNGKLEGERIGVYAAANSPTVDILVQALKDAGFEPVDVAKNDAQQTDTQAVTAQEKLLGTRFKDKGVTTVLVTGIPAPGASYDAIDFHPAMYVDNSGILTAGAFTNPYEKFPAVGAVGASAELDAGYDTPVMQRCREAWNKATGETIRTETEDIAAGESSSNVAMKTICTALEVFVQAATKAGETLNQRTWMQGLESIGKISLPIVPVASFGPGKPDAQDTFQLVHHDPDWKPGSTKQEFVPVGEPLVRSD
jgi:hypothetical protein